MNSFRKHVVTLCILLCLPLGTLAQAESKITYLPTDPRVDDQSREDWAYSPGVQAYIFGLPLLVFEREYALRTNPEIIAKIRHKCPCEMLNTGP